MCPVLITRFKNLDTAKHRYSFICLTRFKRTVKRTPFTQEQQKKKKRREENVFTVRSFDIKIENFNDGDGVDV